MKPVPVYSGDSHFRKSQITLVVSETPAFFFTSSCVTVRKTLV